MFRVQNELGRQAIGGRHAVPFKRRGNIHEAEAPVEIQQGMRLLFPKRIAERSALLPSPFTTLLDLDSRRQSCSLASGNLGSDVVAETMFTALGSPNYCRAHPSTCEGVFKTSAVNWVGAHTSPRKRRLISARVKRSCI